MNNSFKTKKKIENIEVVPEPYRTNIRQLVSLADEIFEVSEMVGSQEHELFYASIEGQIVLSLMPIKRQKGKFHSLSDFYIRDECRGNVNPEFYNLNEIVYELYAEFTPITKFKKNKYRVNDWVTIGKVVGYKSIGYRTITRNVRVVEIDNRNISRPDEISAVVKKPDESMSRLVIEGKPDTIFWRII